MFGDKIEQMKRDFTDKYVLVDATKPELARFRDVVGRVKTVNMNGRALVEFDEYHLNIGWYDIAPEYLKVVDKPPPKPAKPEAKKPAPTQSTPAEKTEEAPAPVPAKKAATVAANSTEKVDKSKMSIDDIIAWCREHDTK